MKSLEEVRHISVFLGYNNVIFMKKVVNKSAFQNDNFWLLPIHQPFIKQLQTIASDGYISINRLILQKSAKDFV